MPSSHPSLAPSVFFLSAATRLLLSAAAARGLHHLLARRRARLEIVVRALIYESAPNVGRGTQQEQWANHFYLKKAHLVRR